MGLKNLVVSEKHGIVKIVLNNPPLNTLDMTVLKELAQVISSFGTGKKTKVIVITGQGKSFSAGADVKKMVDMSPKEAEDFSWSGQWVFNKLENVSKPVIAAVNGYAFGGGCELALACDWIYAAESAEFGQPEITLGIIPGWGATLRLPRRIGETQAKQLIFTGKIIDAKEAYQIGLVNKIFSDESFTEEVEKESKKLANLSPFMLEAARESIEKHVRPLSEYAKERRLFSLCFKTYDQKEGMRAFLEKRKPKFEGR